MTVRNFTVEKFSVISARTFEDVLAGLDKGIGRPNTIALHKQMRAATSFSELQKIIHSAVGSADLMEFLRLDLGAPIRLDPQANAFKIVRIIAGNPLIMKQMVEHVPEPALTLRLPSWSTKPRRSSHLIRHDGKFPGPL